MSEQRCDVAVVGLGAMGAMALWRLARRGVRCVGIDRLSPPHPLGSSHGDSRIIRTAYAEGAFHVPLLVEALTLWRALAEESGEELLHVTGALMIGPPEGGLVGGALASARAWGLEHELLHGAAAAARLPQHRLGPDDTALVEPGGGVLRPERCVAAALARAAAHRAELWRDDGVVTVESAGNGSGAEGPVAVVTGSGRRLLARCCIVAAGAWTGRLLPDARLPLRVERQVQAWLALRDANAARMWAPARARVWVRELAGGRVRYGVPTLDGRRVKLAVHHEGAEADPDTVDRTVHPTDLDPLRETALRWLVGVSDEVLDATVCHYTNTPDERFIVGPAPGMPGVVLLGGCSGHSFKFASVLGDVAADLAIDGATARDVAALAPDRPALTATSR